MIEQLATDWRDADLEPRLAALLAYAEKLTRAPGEVEEADLQGLRDAGLDDQAVLHLCEVVAYYNFVNRTAEGLGVDLEDHWRHPTLGDQAGGGEREGA